MYNFKYFLLIAHRHDDAKKRLEKHFLALSLLYKKYY